MNEEIFSRNKNINRGYRKLDIWKQAIFFYAVVHKTITKYPKIAFRIKEQIEGSSFSVHSNIAEGYSRRTIKETLRYYEISLSSAAECFSQLTALFISEQISEDDFNILDTKVYEVENKLINMNKDLINRFNSGEEWRISYD